MASPVSRPQVLSVVRYLNSRADQLGWHRRYRFVAGSHASGVNHKLETYMPEREEPISVQPIGNTFSKAHKYLQAMASVFEDAVLERDRQRSAALGLSLPVGTRVSRTDERDGVDWSRHPAG